jgi:hyperosmotically inducible protein
MKIQKVSTAAVALAALMGSQYAPAQMDNTRTNKTDPANSSVTADAQKNDAGDLELTRNIRKAVMADKSLSTYAHNIKIVAVNGTVTLNGVVRSDDEKSKVLGIARNAVGQGQVIDDLKVAPPKS